jgi:hypothetical protein
VRTKRAHLVWPSGSSGKAQIRSRSLVRKVLNISVGLAADDHHPIAIEGGGLEGGVLAHGGEDLPEDFDIQSRRFVIV